MLSIGPDAFQASMWSAFEPSQAFEMLSFTAKTSRIHRGFTLRTVGQCGATQPHGNDRLQH
jgi:hypothetical protein